MTYSWIVSGVAAAVLALAGASAAMAQEAALALRLAEGAIVEVEITQALSSKLAVRGERFGLRLAKPASVNGEVVAPAGAAGFGEVVHAAPSKGGGKPGELLLAARYVEFDGVKIALRGLSLGGQGKDRTLTTLIVAQGVGPFALFVKGGEIEIPSGTMATAKVAAAIELPPIPSAKGSTP